VHAGDIFAIFGVECATGDTLVEGNEGIRCASMFVPDAVMSLSAKPTKESSERFQKAVSKFVREDPTFRMKVDKESEEIILSGMGELHLQIYAERMRREFNVNLTLGAPTVNLRETIRKKTKFDYLHKKQSGGAGQFARVIGYVEPISPI
jgi:elongation factor G